MLNAVTGVTVETASIEEGPMARKPNYDFEKRQKEIAKKAKKEEKKQAKLAEKEESSQESQLEE